MRDQHLFASLDLEARSAIKLCGHDDSYIRSKLFDIISTDEMLAASKLPSLMS